MILAHVWVVDFGSAFPFEGNWNSTSNFCSPNAFKTPLDPLSRLKGIETVLLMPTALRRVLLWIRFPVWRELKRYIIAVSGNIKEVLWIRFPVWRELKHYKFNAIVNLERFALSLLSRLKGIETWSLGSVRRNRESFFVSAFPFEGNWNSPGSNTCCGNRIRFCICVPVWRELKLCFPMSTRNKRGTFDLLSRLKGIETSEHQSVLCC